ncbi:MAG: hypothetical protein ACE5PT_05055 [Gemmatimonadales bacterium]
MLKLTKRYCDCVSDAGDLFIGYSAWRILGAPTIPYAAVIH